MRCLSKKNIIVKIKKKTPKNWYQSTGRGMGNDQTIRQASGFKRKSCVHINSQAHSLIVK